MRLARMAIVAVYGGIGSSSWLTASAIALRQGADAQSSSSHRLILPAIVIRRPPNLPSHQTSGDAVLARAAAAHAQAVKETSPQRAAQRLLGAANIVLAYGPVESAGAVFYGVATEADCTNLAEHAARARDYIQKARDVVHLASSSPDGAPDWSGDVGRDADMLSIWADAFGALAKGASTDADAQCGPMLARLSVLLESDRADVVACAGLWSVPLARTPEQRSSLLRELPLALEEPQPQSLPWGALLRLKRAELEAQQGRHASALALLTQQRESVGTRWIGSNDALQFKHAAAWFQCRVLQTWDEALTKPDQADERRWCDNQLKRLRDDVLGSEPSEVLPIFPLIPTQSQALSAPE